jgi:hypothetical protein
MAGAIERIRWLEEKKLFGGNLHLIGNTAMSLLPSSSTV